jgi:hypothetical protein
MGQAKKARRRRLKAFGSNHDFCHLGLASFLTLTSFSPATSLSALFCVIMETPQDYIEDAPADIGILSYDDNIAYAEQLTSGPSLADRISRNKVYLLSESAVVRAGKVRKKPTIGYPDTRL